ncbi:thermonuclease family protein [Iodobacter sp. BJB302]|uniref:thermonuclease family protein n=1 Tax=Iodobacter sp. BJB302 TaxID=1506510 RepID=UPI0015D4AB68|nr:thermonuclease family protein [Iodobacter sp. BJB302]
MMQANLFFKLSEKEILKSFLHTLLFAFISFPLHAETLTGQIIGISDGDTATLLTSAHQPVKIRLGQIDAPEKAQAFGEKSKQSLSELIYGKNVSVEVETKDKYGRTVGKILVGNLDANLEQVKRGMAWFYVQYGHDMAYRDAESKAKASRLGLWSDISPTAPWDWRHGTKADGTKSLETSSVLSTSTSGSSFSCGSKRYCKEMSSCEEAKFYLQHCGVQTIDGDRDGVPCEKLCR